MFGLFKKKSEPDSNEHAVLISAQFDSKEEFGLESERGQLTELERGLRVALSSIGAELDGHDVGEGGFILYAYGTDADKMLEVMQPILQGASFGHFDITKRYGGANNPAARVEKLRLDGSTT